MHKMTYRDIFKILKNHHISTVSDLLFESVPWHTILHYYKNANHTQMREIFMKSVCTAMYV